MQELFSKKEFFYHFACSMIHESGINIDLSVTDKCDYGCLHCLGDDRRAQVKFSKLEMIDERYFISKYVGINSYGNSLRYSDDGKDLVDVFRLFYEKGVRTFSFLFPNISNRDLKIVEGLRELKNDKEDVKYEVGLSYHLYLPVDDKEVVDVAKRRFKYSVDVLSKITDNIKVQVRGDLKSRYRNLVLALETYTEAAFDLGFKSKEKCDSFGKCGGILNYCMTKEDLQLCFSGQPTQKFGRWLKTLREKKIEILKPEEESKIRSLIGIEKGKEKLEKRWFNLRDINSFYVHTNGDIDVSYSVQVLANPREIANLYEQKIDEVKKLWVAYLWDHFISSNKDNFQDTVLFEH